MAPVSYTACPFPKNIHGGQVKHFKQGVFCREDAFSFSHFPKLPMIALDHVGCVDDFPDFRGVLEKGGDLSPI